MSDSRIRFIAVIYLSFFATILQAQHTEEFVHVKVQRLNDSYIDVYHHKPTGDVKLPVVIFCQGSGYNSGTNEFLGLLQPFNTKAVGLVIEKQGVKFGDQGDTLRDDFIQNNSVHQQLYDYLRVLQYMRVNMRWWNGEVYVIGGSEGGLLAGLLASFYPNVKAVAILSYGAGLNFGEAWSAAIHLQKKAEGATANEIEKDIEAFQDTLHQIRKNPTYLKSYNGRANTYAWWSSIMDVRLQNALLDLTIPIYLAQGAQDLTAPPSSARLLKEAFIRNKKSNLIYKEYPDYDHAFKDNISESHFTEVVTEAIKWLVQVK